jgi:hypothetical protein
VGDDAADPAGSDDKDFVHDLQKEAQSLGNPGPLARNSQQPLAIPHEFSDKFKLAWRFHP